MTGKNDIFLMQDHSTFLCLFLMSLFSRVFIVGGSVIKSLAVLFWAKKQKNKKQTLSIFQYQ